MGGLEAAHAAIAQRAAEIQALGMQLPALPHLRFPPAAPPSNPRNTYEMPPAFIQVHGQVNATTSGPPPVAAEGTRATRRDWYEYTVARTSTVATLNAATAVCRAITTAVGAAVAAAPPGAPTREDLARRTPVMPVQQLLRHAQLTMLPQPAAGAAAAAAPTLSALVRARISASEKLKAIATALADRPPTPTNIPSEARNEAVDRVLSEIALIADATEREEALRMLERILTPGSLHQVRSIYDSLPAWEENRPPPEGWPFRLPGQRAEMQRRRGNTSSLEGSAREREYTRDNDRRMRNIEANDAARDYFEEMLHMSASGTMSRLPRIAPSAVPSFEMVQLRDLPTLIAVQGMRVPPEQRIDDGDEQVVPTGPSIRSTHTVPVNGTQARLRESLEFEYRRRFEAMQNDSVQRARQRVESGADDRARAAMDRGQEPPPRAAAPPYQPRPTDTPHPGVVIREWTGPMIDDSLVGVSPLVTVRDVNRGGGGGGGGAAGAGAAAQGPPAQRMRPEQLEWMMRQHRQRQQLSTGAPPMQQGQPTATPVHQTGPSTSKPVVPTDASAGTSEGKIIVHKLRARTHRAPGQRKECSGLVGARRLIMEQKALEEKGGVERVEAAPKPENIRTWTSVVEGADGSQYEGGIFFFDIDFPQSYPMVRSEGIKIKCLTHIVHPYVRRSGIVDAEAVAQLCFGVKFSEMKYGGVEKSLMVAAAVVSGKLPDATPEQTKQWLERGKIFTERYAC